MYTIGIISLIVIFILFLVIYVILTIRRSMKKTELLKEITNKTNLVEAKFLSIIDTMAVDKEDIDTLRILLIAMYIFDRNGTRYQKIAKEIEKRGYKIKLRLSSSGAVIPEAIE